MIILKEFIFPFYISVLIITGLSARVYGVALILFGVLYSFLYKGKERKKLCWIAPDDTVLAFKILVDVVGIGVGPLNFFFYSAIITRSPQTGTEILCHWGLVDKHLGNLYVCLYAFTLGVQKLGPMSTLGLGSAPLLFWNQNVDFLSRYGHLPALPRNEAKV